MDDEVIHTPADKHVGMLEKLARTRGVGEARRPALWCAKAAQDFAPAPVFGAYPKRFVRWAVRAIRCDPGEVLHVCSGMLDASDGGVRVDMRQDARPSLRADGRSIPIRDSSFGGVLIDPPYSVEYAQELYGTEYPRPSHLLAEAARVVVPGGRIGILHFFVPSPPKGCVFDSVTGVTTGCGYRIRAFSVFRRAQDDLPGITSER